MIIFSNPQFLANEIACIHRLFNEGLKVLHLRKPAAGLQEMSDFISRIDSRFHSRIMIHSHYELLDSFELRGIHFTEKTKCQQFEYANKPCIKSIGIHTLDESDLLNSFIDYAFLSPIFPSVSKKGYSKEWDFEFIKLKLTQKRNFKIVALGGITPDNVHRISELGFDDFAILGSIWGEEDQNSFSMDRCIEIYKKFEYER